jgi:HEAT repeat protein/ATP/ADP translocase
MKRLASLFAIHPDEASLAGLLIGLMLLTSIGNSLGVSGIEALFFARFGVTYLPLIYMIQGVLTLIVTLSVSAVLGGRSRNLIYVLMPVVMAAVLIGERFLTGFTWFLPVMWLLKEVLNSLMGLYVWGVASARCDTRQAKRLFPLFSAGRILGSVVGGLTTGPLVGIIGTENLLIVWAITLSVAFVVTQQLLGQNLQSLFAGAGLGPAATERRVKRRQTNSGFIHEVQQGYQFVRGSTLMRWISLAVVLFSALYFSVALPFSKAATMNFPDEGSLAGFLGLFNALSTGAAFLVSLFLANRLYARFGVMNAILALPIIYFLGFGVLAAFDLFPVLVVYKFTQMLWLAGIADSAYQAMFNAVPNERRDQVRAFIDGVPSQTGTFIAGFILIIGEQSLQSQQLYLIGLGLGLACTYVIWQASRAYSGALVAALKSGQPHLFIGSDSLGNIQRDSTAVGVAVAGVTDPDPAIRRVSAEILGSLSTPQATASLVSALADSDSHVRAASLRALVQARAASALLDVATCLHDPDPEVRVGAVDAVRQLAGYAPGVRHQIEPMLTDPDPQVRARSALALLKVSDHVQAKNLLRQMAALGEADEQVCALTALGEWGDAEAFALIETTLQDRASPAMVRRAAAQALVPCGAEAVPCLIEALDSDDRSVRDAVAEALGQIGAPAVEPTVAALFKPATEHGAIHALEHLPLNGASTMVRTYAREKVAKAIHYQALYLAVKRWTMDDKVKLLADSLQTAARFQGLHALRAVNLLGDRQSLVVVMENLQSRDSNQRANALETLESIREATLVKPMLKVWDDSDTAVSGVTGDLSQTVAQLLREPDAWLRACTLLAVGAKPIPGIDLSSIAETDPDPLVRGEAAKILSGEVMDTLATLSLMERILFLKKVPLFADLPPTDLKQVAAISNEVLFSNEDLIVAQGETGDEMFVIVSGEVGVRVKAEGKDEVQVAQRKAGDVVGEMAIINREPRMASLVALGETRMLCIDRKSFEGLLRERPEVCLAVMRVLALRLKDLSK